MYTQLVNREPLVNRDAMAHLETLLAVMDRHLQAQPTSAGLYLCDNCYELHVHINDRTSSIRSRPIDESEIYSMDMKQVISTIAEKFNLGEDEVCISRR